MRIPSSIVVLAALMAVVATGCAVPSGGSPVRPGVAALRTTASASRPAPPVTGRAPLARPITTTRPENGAVLTRHGSGPGTITIDNGTGRDAVVTLADGPVAVRAIYIRAASQARATGIPDGTYVVFVQQGSGWDPKARRFTAGSSSGRFDKVTVFTTRRTPRSVEYVRYTMTLHSVPSGNAHIQGVNPDIIPG